MDMVCLRMCRQLDIPDNIQLFTKTEIAKFYILIKTVVEQ